MWQKIWHILQVISKIAMKKILNTMMLCVIIISITNCGSKDTSENVIVAEAVETLCQELPIHLEGLGYVREIIQDDGAVIFRMRIKEEAAIGLNVAKITNQILGKEILSLQIGMMDKQEKEAIKLIAGQSYGLKLIIKGSESNKGVISLSPEEIESALTNARNKSKDDFALEMIAMATRLMLPVQIGPITMWTDARVSSNTFEYVYHIDDTNDELSEINKDMIKNAVSQNMGSLYKNIVGGCIATHRNFVCTYIGNITNKKVKIVLTESDLKNIY